MAMAMLQKCSILQQSLSFAHSVSSVKQSQRGNSQRVCASQRVCGSQVYGNSVSFLLLATMRNFTRGRIPDRRGSWRAKVGEEKTDSGPESVSLGESKLGEAKGFGAPPKALGTDTKRSSKSSSGSIRRAPPSKPLIGVQAASQQTQQIETAIVASLVFLFGVIILEGLTLAVSGFLPEEWDQFVVKSVYPAFTPSVGVFLAIAAGYGLWKYFGGGTGTSSS